jgi:hypothetical protein
MAMVENILLTKIPLAGIAGEERERFAKLSVRVAFRYDEPPHFFVTLL